MKQLLKYLRDYRKEAVIGPLFKLLEACFELIVPIVMARIVDVGIRQADTAYILRMGALLLLFGLLGLSCSVTAQYFAAKAAYGFGTMLRRDLFAHINRLSFAELDRAGTSTLITRITGDINQVQSGVNLVLRLFLRSPFIVLGALIAAFLINARLALIFLGATVLLSLAIYLIMKLNIPIYQRVQQQLDQISLITRENLMGVRVIRAFARQEEEKERFGDANTALRGAQTLAGKISALLNPVTYVIVNLAIVLILWQGGGAVNTGALTQGELIALVNYMTQILLALVALATLIISFTKATASAARVNMIFAYTPSVEAGSRPVSPSPACRTAVEFRNVSFRYAGAEDNALDAISFSIQKGQTVGIIGGTGAGKSTLVHLLSRFYDVTDGEILLNGVPLQDYPFAQLREIIGLVPQRAVLFRGTIRENMRWRKKDASDEEIWRALSIAQAGFVKDKPEGLDSLVMQEGKNFSGGQRQRLTIARALVGDPMLLILDDSASALDFATEARLRHAIREETQGEMTVLTISQRAATLVHADQILVLDDGRLAGAGTHAQLLESCPVYREICLSQHVTEEVQRHEA